LQELYWQIYIINKQIKLKKMAKKLVWFESYTTICKYYTELTDEEAKLFEEDEE
jgi:hypothetical protein